MGRQGDRQGDLMVMWSEMPRSPGHVFYDRLQEVLVGAGFDGFVEDACQARRPLQHGRLTTSSGARADVHVEQALLDGAPVRGREALLKAPSSDLMNET